MRIAILLIVLAACVDASAAELEPGDEVRWFVATDLMPHGPAIEMPFALERYRGGAIALVCWRDNGSPSRRKKKIHEDLAELIYKLRKRGVLVVGVSDDRELVTKGLTGFDQRGPILLVEPAALDPFGTFDNGVMQRYAIGPDGRILEKHQVPAVVEALEPVLADCIPMGRWACLSTPWFPRFSTVAKVAALQEQVHAGRIGRAMDKARHHVEDAEDDALVNEATYLLSTCQAWIDHAIAIENAALAVGDAYTAWAVADRLAELLRGTDAGDAAKDRAKAHEDLSGYDTGEDFAKLRRKTYGRSREEVAQRLLAFAEDHPGSYEAGLVQSWYGE